MKIALLFLVLLQLFPSAVQAAFYQWDDAGGVTHFTDDPDKIPARYQKRAKKLDLSEAPPAYRGAKPGAQPSPQGGAPSVIESAPLSYGGQSEQWWRNRFASLRGELQSLSEGLPDKQAKLSELRRKRAIYMRAQDREAVNSMQAVISADELRISELQKQIAELEGEASRSGVPTAWRQ